MSTQLPKIKGLQKRNKLEEEEPNSAGDTVELTPVEDSAPPASVKTEQERPKKEPQVKWAPRNDPPKSEKFEPKEPDSKPAESARTPRDVDLDEKWGDHAYFSQNMDADTKPFAKPSAKNHITLKRALIIFAIAFCVGLVIVIIVVGIIAAVLLTTRINSDFSLY
jgi:hypothetical protein